MISVNVNQDTDDHQKEKLSGVTYRSCPVFDVRLKTGITTVFKPQNKWMPTFYPVEHREG